MHSWPAFACLAFALVLLAWLSVIDLRVRLLPNELVAGVALLGILFHVLTRWVICNAALRRRGRGPWVRTALPDPRRRKPSL